MFADRRSLVDPRHWRFLVEVLRFLRRARLDLRRGLPGAPTLDRYLVTRQPQLEIVSSSRLRRRCGRRRIAAASPCRTILRFLTTTAC
jgi:hypothetical protein